MKVIIVCSGTKGILSPYIKEQMDSLIRLEGIEFLLFQIKRKGVIGYLSYLNSLSQKIKLFKPDLIHAHYGLSGLFANLQRKIPVITTFHGSDINDPKILKWSKWAHSLSKASIFVEETMLKKIKSNKKSNVIPCGIDKSIFFPIPKFEALKSVGIIKDEINILFASDFNNPVKNYPLARESCKIAQIKLGIRVNLIELKGLSRESVNLYFNACDVALLFSSYEGSPQFIKEAMACNCPIVSTNVGDIFWIIGETEGCFITSIDIQSVADKLIEAIHFSETVGRTNGRNRILSMGLDTDGVATRVLEVYREVSNQSVS